MSNNIYERVFNRSEELKTALNEVIRDGREESPLYIYPETVKIDEKIICLDIDLFVKEYPDTYFRYLSPIYDVYEKMRMEMGKFYREIQPYRNDEREKFFDTIDYVFHHLEFVLGLESTRFIDIITRYRDEAEAQEQTKSITTPKGLTKLNRKQTALLFFYLRERQLIAQPTNENMAKAITLLSGHGEKQIKDIIRTQGTPVYQLGKDNDKVTTHDFRSIIIELDQLIKQIDRDQKTYSNNNELR